MGTLIKERRAARASPPLPEVEIVRLEPGDDPGSLASRLDSVARIEVHFPTFGDGRGYSIARLLRSRYGYRGELRAVGHITRDQLVFLERVGFDAFELRAGEDATEALIAFETFSAAYQKQ